MKISLLVRNIVIVGNFHVSKFDKFFFIKNAIFQENEIIDSSVFSDHFVQLVTTQYSIQVLQNQLVVSLINMDLGGDVDLLTKKIITNSEISATAIGMNYHYAMFTEGRLNEISKKHFYIENNNLIDTFFTGDDVNYGYYLSKKTGKSRLKLDIKPSLIMNVSLDKNEDIISFAFNFHSDVNLSNCKKEILDVLNESSLYHSESQSIMKIYEE